MYKNNIDIFLEENEKFQEDLELSQRRLKLIDEWDSNLPDIETLGNFDIDYKKTKKTTQKRSYKISEINLKKSNKQTKNLF